MESSGKGLNKIVFILLAIDCFPGLEWYSNKGEEAVSFPQERHPNP